MENSGSRFIIDLISNSKEKTAYYVNIKFRCFKILNHNCENINF